MIKKKKFCNQTLKRIRSRIENVDLIMLHIKQLRNIRIHIRLSDSLEADAYFHPFPRLSTFPTRSDGTFPRDVRRSKRGRFSKSTRFRSEVGRSRSVPSDFRRPQLVANHGKGKVREAEGKELNIEWKGDVRIESPRRWRRWSNDRCWQPDARTETDTRPSRPSPPSGH